jgi:diguanylate cyclase (GGDEF)-like protein
MIDASEDRSAGDHCPRDHRLPFDEQVNLCDDLNERASENVSVQDLLEVVFGGLAGCLGLRSAAVFKFDRGNLDPQPVAEVGTASWQLSGPANPQRVTLPLRTRGKDVGLLSLAGARLPILRPECRSLLARCLAVTLCSHLDAEEHVLLARSSRAVRRLYEEGSSASSVEIAGEVLARVTAEAFRTELAAVNVVDFDGRICLTIGVGVSADLSRELASSLIGRFARDSPVWRRAEEVGGPVLVDDADSTAVRSGGFVRTMKLRCYIAMPLMSADGPVGMAMCGDVSGTRAWTDRDRELARELALAGALIIDSARLRQAEHAHVAQLTYRAFHDSLTGLGNRAFFLDQTALAVGTALKTGRHLALLFLDLDGFKGINDTMGHQAGDLLLQQVAHRLTQAVRDVDTPTRLGGDEFAVVLADADQDLAVGVADRIQRELRQPFDLDGTDRLVDVSIGIALCPEHARDVTGLLQCADKAMYESKRNNAGPKMYLGHRLSPGGNPVADFLPVTDARDGVRSIARPDEGF